MTLDMEMFVMFCGIRLTFGTLPKTIRKYEPRKPTNLLFQSGILSRLMLANWRCFVMLSILGP